MPKKKPEPVKPKENEARKPVVQKAIADTSGSNLDDFKNAAKNVGKAYNDFMKPGGGLNELTGFNDLTRFVKNPSKGNLAGLGLSATQYLGGSGASALSNAIGRSAGNTARYAARILPDEVARAAQATSRYASRVIPDEVSRVVTRVLKLGDNQGRLTTMGNSIQNIVGKSVATERVVSPAQIAAGRGLAAANQARPLAQGRLQGLAVGNFIRQTEKLSNKKDTKKK